MKTRVRLAPAAEVPEGQAREFSQGAETIAVCNVAGTFYALDGICPHAGGPLGHGALHATTLVCPFHAWEFDCRTGACNRNPAARLRTYPVTVEDGWIVIEVD